MKFVCERCHTKYSIADDKVRQKILKIRCKTCENVITIRDAVVVHEPRATSEPRGVRAVPPAPPARATRAVEWHIAVDGRQEGPLGLAMLVSRIQAVPRTSEIYVWNEHLDGWKEPKLVPEVASELRIRSAPSMPAVPPPPPPLPGKKLPGPSGARPAVSGPLPVAGGPRRSGSHGSVEMGGTRPVPAPAAASASFLGGAEGEGERTQIQPVDASRMMADLAPAPPPAKPVSPFTPHAVPGPGVQPGRSSGSHPIASSDILPRSSGSHPVAPSGLRSSGALPRANGSGASSSGLEALDFVPGQHPPPGIAGPVTRPSVMGPLPGTVAGGSTATLLAQIGGRASRPRHPAFKFVVTGGLLVGLVIVVAVLALSDRDRAGGVGKPALAEATAPGTAGDPEARARAEAEKVFKSMVGERPAPPAPVVAKASTSVGPSPRRGPVRPRHQDPTPLAPPPLAPPPLSAGGPQLSPDGVGVARRFATGERKVANPGKDRGAMGADGNFDHQKFMGVFKQQDHHTAIKSCYERALKRDERLKLARLDISVNVGETGSVKRVRVDAPPEFNGVSSCIREAVRRWRFPSNSQEYEASFPLILHGNAD
jgi:predicted Zn finger-like uncharacterized protein